MGAECNLKAMADFIVQNKKDFKVLASSSHRVSAFLYEGKRYVLKEQLLNPDCLSPFWQMIKDVFSSDFTSQRAEIRVLWELLSQNPHIAAVKPVLTEESQRYTVLEWMEGMAWEPDEFPDNEEICRQLGRFIGFNHTLECTGFGRIGRPETSDFGQRIREYVRKKYPEEKRAADLLEQAEKSGGLSGPFVPIMVDISANQFLFSENKITACVDLDAYVLGPREWELAVLSACVPCIDAFWGGYEEYKKIPAAWEVARDLYLYLME